MEELSLDAYETDIEEANKQYAEKLREAYSWVESKVTSTGIEPSVSQVENGYRWVTARWSTDLLRNPEYKPSVDFAKSLIASEINLKALHANDYSDDEQPLRLLGYPESSFDVLYIGQSQDISYWFLTLVLFYFE